MLKLMYSPTATVITGKNVGFCCLRINIGITRNPKLKSFSYIFFRYYKVVFQIEHVLPYLTQLYHKENQKMSLNFFKMIFIN